MNKLLQGVLMVLLTLCVVIRELHGAPMEVKYERVSNWDEFSNSLKLSKKLLNESRNLKIIYVESWLKGAHVNFSRSLGNLPLASIKINDWLRLKAGERLRLLHEGLQVFPVYLKKLEEWKEKEDSHLSGDGSIPFARRISIVQLDLRDLLHHIKIQMSVFKVSPSESLTVMEPSSDGSDWHSRIVMFQALRSMEQFLFRAVREYTALRHTTRD
ncbi:uncharacterized protein LOC121398812 [Xenopus laevis]|uniref:Uncharacterized protein LOC121398812 n=1 Tax=Xenopus laevis TaxID=8355 RepID=A0A8J1LXF7_XENLA|nr:uncharacterized protein LOC121398812 [Xenopus laevis]OCT58314.1 hypothetical protein XELAEV_18002252mg [Xenopus laevis]